MKVNIISIKELSDEIKNNPMDFNSQGYQIENGMRWTCDMWHLEILKCLMLGEAQYLKSEYSDYIPNKVPQFLEMFKNYTRCKIESYNRLQEVKNLSDNLIVCEIGRGIDLLLAIQVKKWNKIVCYDTNQYCGKFIIDYFKKHFNIEVSYIHANSGDINFNDGGKINFHSSNQYFNEDCIIIADGTQIYIEGIKKIWSNSKIKAFIVHGNIPKTIDDFLAARDIKQWSRIPARQA